MVAAVNGIDYTSFNGRLKEIPRMAPRVGLYQLISGALAKIKDVVAAQKMAANCEELVDGEGNGAKE